jgi:hypothetical protein
MLSGLKHETEGEAVGRKVRSIAIAEINIIFADVTFHIELAVEIVT